METVFDFMRNINIKFEKREMEQKLKRKINQDDLKKHKKRKKQDYHNSNL